MVTVHSAAAGNWGTADGSGIDDDIHEKPFDRIIVLYTAAVLFAP